MTTAAALPRPIRYVSAPDTAKLIRAALKAEFPRVKFSVACSRGSAINVRWTDGPTARRVDAIVGAFKGATFDGMTDCRDSIIREIAGERVRYLADFIFTNRTIGSANLAKVGALVATMYGVECPPVVDGAWGATFDARHPSTERRVGGGHFTFAELVRQACEDRTRVA